MTRVLMTADAVGGVWTYALELARALARHEFETTLVVMGPRPSDVQRAQAARVPGLRLEVTGLALEWMLEARGLWDEVQEAGRRLLDLESQIGPAIVHLNGYAHGALPFRAPVVVVGHSCVLSWRAANGGVFNPVVLDAYRQAVIDGLARADCVVAPTRAMLASLQHHYGPLERTMVIPNGRDAACVPVAPKEPLVATAGRLWDRGKNMAAVQAIAGDLDWPVAIAGSADPNAQAPTDTVLALLARASIFALPARYEPFGLLPLEAALAGCALVLGDIPSLREVWADAALYVDPDDRSALRNAVRSLIADPDRRASLAVKARRHAAAYTTSTMARAYVDLYAATGASRRCA